TKLLGRESKKELFRQHWTAPLDGSYGLGFDVSTVDRKRIVGHGGGFPGFITRLSLNLDDDVGVIVLANANESPSGFIAEGIFETIGRFADPSKDYFKGARAASLRRFEGAYRSRWSDRIVVSTGSRLVAFPPQTHSPLKEGTVLRPA